MQALGQVIFDVHTPVPGDVPNHIMHALSLGLPEADQEPIKRLTIIANGPSAREAPLFGETLALNGAIKLFPKGHHPTYWAACDPQRDHILNCLNIPLSQHTTYFVASKCHPDVFKRLEGFDVRLWHINDYTYPEGIRPVPTAVSVTLTSMSLMRRLGYRAFDVWGWDACYINGEHHASDHEPLSSEFDCDVVTGAEQKTTPRKVTKRQLKVYENLKAKAVKFGYNLPEEPNPIMEYIGGREFKTTRSWTLEAQDALTQLQCADYEVTIHGDGMIKALRESGTRIG